MAMEIYDREDQDVVDALEVILVRAIRGAFWFPFVFLPLQIRRAFPAFVSLLRQLQRAFPVAAKVSRVCAMLAAWAVFVFGPLAFLEEVDGPIVIAIVGWTVLAAVGSAVGVMSLRRSAAAHPGAEKPAGFADAFV
jgi:hypothetical protein